MKVYLSKTVLYLFFVGMLMLTSSCTRHPSEVWEDTKSCGRHFNKGLSVLRGREGTSRQVQSRDEFIGWQEQPQCDYGFQESEYLPLPRERECHELAMADIGYSQPYETPGDPGSSIPGIDSFRDPSSMKGMDSVYKNIYFDYNSNLVKGDSNQAIVHSIARHLRNNPNTYIFVEGHCDERGPEAYNLALGARRSNAVRTMLLEDGVDGDHVFTISYGKERPLVFGANDQSWAQNRRVEFKIYQR